MFEFVCSFELVGRATGQRLRDAEKQLMSVILQENSELYVANVRSFGEALDEHNTAKAK